MLGYCNEEIIKNDYPGCTYANHEFSLPLKLTIKLNKDEGEKNEI